MSIGFGIFLMTAGAILAFGIRDRSDAVDLSVVGVIVMLAGACGIWLSYTITNKRRRVETQTMDTAVEEEYRTIQADEPIRAKIAPSPSEPAPATDRSTPPGRHERHIDLDPAASGLNPTDRSPRPDPVTEPTPAANGSKYDAWTARVVSRFRSRT